MDATNTSHHEVPRLEPPPPDPTAERCHLLGPTALIVQALMGVFVIGSLVVKRHLEKRKRPWRVWALDVAKQLVGQGVIHMLNLLISLVVAGADASNPNNPCSLYFLNILIDTTVGVGIIYLALKGFTALFVRHYGPNDYITGHYGVPPQMSVWLRQLQPYLLAVIAMKLVVLLPLTLPGISGLLIRAGQSVLSALPLDVQVVFVLSIFPLIMNVLQFCLIDQLIKDGKHPEREGDMEMGESYAPLATEEVGHGHGHGQAHTRGRRGSQLGLSRSRSRSHSKASSRAGSSTSVIFSDPEDEDEPLYAENGYGEPRSPRSKPKVPSVAGSFWSRRTGDTDAEEVRPEHFELDRRSSTDSFERR